MKKNCFGFGVEPNLAQNHFYVVIVGKKSDNQPVRIYERYMWTSAETASELDGNVIIYADNQVVDTDDNNNRLRLEIPRTKWDAISKTLTSEFNNRLKAERKPSGRFAIGGTPVERMFGKEMMVLLWGIENCDPSNIPTAIRNWKGLIPEERWWLYTMTNASSGGLNDGNKGWRKALRYALCENPIIEERHIQATMFSEAV